MGNITNFSGSLLRFMFLHFYIEILDEQEERYSLSVDGKSSITPSSHRPLFPRLLLRELGTEIFLSPSYILINFFFTVIFSFTLVSVSS